MKKSIIAAACCALLLASCSAPKPEKADIVVLYTTDVHGACLPYDFKQDQPAATSLANVHTYVKQQREANPDAIMLFDTGDFLQGQPSTYYYNYVDTLSEHVVAKIYNYMDYDALGVGNHDIEPGDAVYQRHFPPMLQMPWLCANAIDTRTGKPMFQPYSIEMRQGIKIAILGMITPHIGAWLPKSLWPNLEFEDMVECARKWIPIIQKKENPDLIIGLFHSGGDPNNGGSDMDTPFNENGGVPAATKVPGFDLILLGHDHSQRDFDIINVNGDMVKALDAGTQSRLIGRADIHLELQSDGTYQKVITTDLIDAKKYEPDPDFCAMVEEDIQKVNHFVDAPIGQLTAPLEGSDGLYGPCAFMDLIHNAQLWATHADVSFAAVLAPYDVIPAGQISMRHLFTIYKYENQLFTMVMTGDEIRRYLEHGFNYQFATMTRPGDPLIKRDEDGRPVTATFNYTSAAGIRYTVDITKPEGQRVSILSMSDGTEFDPQRQYRVAINSYQASGGGNFLPVGLGWDKATIDAHTIDASPIDVRRYIADYIAQQGTITPQVRGDWQVIPTDLWQAGKAREIANVTNRRFR